MRLLLIPLLVCSLGLPVALAEETPYNKGVAAWRAKNFAEARKQWEQSLAEGGPDEALNNLAFLLYNGLGGEARPAKAVELWRKGAALAVSEAQLHLGQAYEAGVGVDRNLATAYAWYRCAIATAAKLSKKEPTEAEIENDAIAALAKLSPRLSVLERNAGEKLATTWISRYANRLSTEP
ncbi:MAG: sel1 repeat family protein [Burkholderiaceae bacterium]|nr:sel1 repeat family protein [Burkholderiaceae bacterium]